MPSISGTLEMAPFKLSGALSVLQPSAGPSTRQSTMTFNLSFGGEYWDELNDKVIDKFVWKADGFKISDKPGTGVGQSNRFWFYEGLAIQSGQSINLDMYSFLSVNGGMGFGSDQLGLNVIMNQITMLYVANRQTGALLKIGGASAAPWNSMLTGRARIPGGHRLIAYNRKNPAWATSLTNRYLKLEAPAGACLIDIFVLGRYTG